MSREISKVISNSFFMFSQNSMPESNAISTFFLVNDKLTCYISFDAQRAVVPLTVMYLRKSHSINSKINAKNT